MPTPVPSDRRISASDEGLQHAAPEALRLAELMKATSCDQKLPLDTRQLAFVVAVELKRLHALASASAGWQDINIAPKGVNVLLHSPRHKLPSVADWADYCRINQPGFTHWMPIAPAPTSAAEAKGGVE